MHQKAIFGELELLNLLLGTESDGRRVIMRTELYHRGVRNVSYLSPPF